MAGQKDSGKVNIHGKEYETVASRVAKFRAEHNTRYSIVTEIVDRDDNLVVMKASIFERVDNDSPQNLIATGFAEESRTSSSINRTSALENAETSAIGRALANFGLAGTEYASADEVANAIQQRQPKPTDEPTDLQRAEIFSLLKHLDVDPPEMTGYVTEKYSLDLMKLDHASAGHLLQMLSKDAAKSMEPSE